MRSMPVLRLVISTEPSVCSPNGMSESMTVVSVGNVATGALMSAVVLAVKVWVFMASIVVMPATACIVLIDIICVLLIV